MTLLDKARNAKVATKIERKTTAETVKLALAWVHDEVSLKQCGIALEEAGGGVYARLAVALKIAVSQGKLK